MNIKEETIRKMLEVLWWCRTLRSDALLFDLENEKSKIKWDIIGLYEVRRAGKSLSILQSGNALFQKGNDEASQKRVGFLIKKKIFSQVELMKGISERVAYVIIETSNKRRIKTIQVYMPTRRRRNRIDIRRNLKCKKRKQKRPRHNHRGFQENK
ncbi:hypothetical protein ILUMI_19312 [Ignelater luminosus]|uniref:Uncharacterized protein n=1 Tax=Ignelater luminosus TaxID=2038154 RepID=A0A8K0CKF6_IGNLU|nr:hypothetical protein ILUMI_19312 [Ignelater luminosus]